jgi:hypothetical protein
MQPLVIPQHAYEKKERRARNRVAAEPTRPIVLMNVTIPRVHAFAQGFSVSRLVRSRTYYQPTSINILHKGVESSSQRCRTIGWYHLVLRTASMSATPGK